MRKSQKVRLYESIMKDIAVQVKRRLNEDEFVAPKRNAKEKFMKMLGKDSGYQERIRKEQEKYFEKKRNPFMRELVKAESFMDLLMICKKMSMTGYIFPIAGMVAGSSIPQNTRLSDVSWMSYDRDSYISAESLAKCEEGSPSNDVYIYTYYYSWRYWCANILRVLYFPNDPWGAKANNEISELMRTYAPKCPIIRLYKDYFKKD